MADLRIARGDLVAATQGRGYRILDDIASLLQLSFGAHVGESVLRAPE